MKWSSSRSGVLFCVLTFPFFVFDENVLSRDEGWWLELFVTFVLDIDSFVFEYS